jgi:hypothetical protein
VVAHEPGTKEVQLYLYLVIILTSDIAFTQHIEATLQASRAQTRQGGTGAWGPSR